MSQGNGLVKKGYRLVVYVPVELRERLKVAAFNRAAGRKGPMSMGAVVRALLEEQLEGDPPRGRRTRDESHLSAVAKPTTSAPATRTTAAHLAA